MHGEIKLSVVIPTHNRAERLHRLLHLLEEETRGIAAEVIVVADNCTDGTIAMLSSFNPPYPFRWLPSKGKGAAATRNTGAAAANGTILLFLDDDIEPGGTLLHSHYKAHTQPGGVVIGYLPFVAVGAWDNFQKGLRSWWADKFYLMGTFGYRFGMEDLLSGNFSVDAALFRHVGGFNEDLCCKEDYELGYRLIKAGAKFTYEPKAWGYHRDSVTTMNRSIQRKRLEGSADVAIARTHPALGRTLHRNYLPVQPSKKLRALYFLMRRIPFITDTIMKLVLAVMPMLEQLKFRYRWQRFNYLLHKYWYIRGVMDVTTDGGFRELQHTKRSATKPLVLDINDGVEAVLQRVDTERPASVQIVKAGAVWFTIDKAEGFESLNRHHLQNAMLDEAKSLAPLLLLNGSEVSPKEMNNDVKQKEVNHGY